MVARLANTIWADTPTTESTDDGSPLVAAQVYSNSQLVAVQIPNTAGPWLDIDGVEYGQNSLQIVVKPAGGVIAAADPITVAEFAQVRGGQGSSTSTPKLDRELVGPDGSRNFNVTANKYSWLIATGALENDNLVMPQYGGLWFGTDTEQHGIIENNSGVTLNIVHGANTALGGLEGATQLHPGEVIHWRQTGPTHTTGYIVHNPSIVAKIAEGYFTGGDQDGAAGYNLSTDSLSGTKIVNNGAAGFALSDGLFHWEMTAWKNTSGTVDISFDADAAHGALKANGDTWIPVSASGVIDATAAPKLLRAFRSSSSGNGNIGGIRFHIKEIANLDLVGYVVNLPTSFVNLGDWNGVSLQTAVTNGMLVGSGAGPAGTGAPSGAFTGSCKITAIGDWIQQDFLTGNAPGTVVGERFSRQSFDGGATWSAWFGQ